MNTHTHTYTLEREEHGVALWRRDSTPWGEVDTGTAHGWQICCPDCVSDCESDPRKLDPQPPDGTRCYLCGEYGETTVKRTVGVVTYIDRKAGQVWAPSGHGRWVGPLTASGIEQVGEDSCWRNARRKWARWVEIAQDSEIGEWVDPPDLEPLSDDLGELLAKLPEEQQENIDDTADSD